MGEEHRERYLPSYQPVPRDWAPHPRKKMLMTPWLVFWGGLLAFSVPFIMAAAFQFVFFHPPFSDNWAPVSTYALKEGRHVYVSNGCIYCHSDYTRPQDVRQGLYYLYPRVSEPGDYVSSDSSPNVWGSARIGPDLSQEGGYHPEDWERAHFYNPRFVTPNSIMPQFNFLSDAQIDALATYVDTYRGGKSGVLRAAGQIYMKRLFLHINNLPPPPKGKDGAKLTLAQITTMFKMNAPTPIPGTVDGLDWSSWLTLNVVDRGYWLSDNQLPVTTENLMRGRLIFQDMCIGCHGQGGSGISRAAGFLRPPPADFTDPNDAASGNDASPGDFYYRILRGIHGTAMENFGTRLRVKDTWAVALFLKTIPNGGLQRDKVVTPDMYIIWKPPPALMTYLAAHPITESQRFLEDQIPSDPFWLEARRVLHGLNDKDKFMVPGFGEVSLTATSRDIKKIYDDILDTAYSDYIKRGGVPGIPPGQRDMPPDLIREWR